MSYHFKYISCMKGSHFCRQVLSIENSGTSLVTYGTNQSRIEQVEFLNNCLPQFLLGPFVNTLSHIYICEEGFCFAAQYQCVNMYSLSFEPLLQKD